MLKDVRRLNMKCDKDKHWRCLQDIVTFSKVTLFTGQVIFICWWDIFPFVYLPVLSVTHWKTSHFCIKKVGFGWCTHVQLIMSAMWYSLHPSTSSIDINMVISNMCGREHNNRYKIIIISHSHCRLVGYTSLQIEFGLWLTPVYQFGTFVIKDTFKDEHSSWWSGAEHMHVYDNHPPFCLVKPWFYNRWKSRRNHVLGV